MDKIPERPNETEPTLEEQNKEIWPMMVVLCIFVLALVIVLFGLIFSIGDTTFGEGLLRSLALWGGGLTIFGLPYLFAAIIGKGDDNKDSFAEDAAVFGGYIITGVIAVVVILIIVL